PDRSPRCWATPPPWFPPETSMPLPRPSVKPLSTPSSGPTSLIPGPRRQVATRGSAAPMDWSPRTARPPAREGAARCRAVAPARGRRWHEAALRRAIERARILAAPTDDTADDLVAAGARAERVRVLTDPYGCDHLPPADAAATTAFLQRLHIDGEYLLTVSTLEPRKNLRRLLAAYR